jgi:hypothetical protein
MLRFSLKRGFVSDFYFLLYAFVFFKFIMNICCFSFLFKIKILKWSIHRGDYVLYYLDMECPLKAHCWRLGPQQVDPIIESDWIKKTDNELINC